MEYEEILKKLGTFGFYQKRLLMIMMLPIIYDSFGTPVSNFILGDQMHRCKIPYLDNDTYEIQNEYHQQLVNATIPVNPDGSYKECLIILNGTEKKCSEWVYDTSTFSLTVNSQFNLVCDDKLWHSHAVTLYFFGFVASTVTMCPFGDVIGRRLVVCLMVTLRFIVNIAMAFSPSVGFFAVCRFLDGYTGLSIYHSSFIIGMELVGPKERLIAGTVIALVFTFGEYILVILAYFIRDWRWLQLTLAVPMVTPLIFWLPSIFPESPRWLISRGRTPEALRILRRVAKVNKVTFPDNLTTVKSEEDEGIFVILKELFQSKKIIVRWVIVTMNWFVISFIYYGITLNIGKLGGNLYVNFTLAVVVETLGYSVCFLLDVTGRKPMHLTLMYGAGVACIASIFPILYGNESLRWLPIVFSMIGKFGVSGGFGEIFIYTGELFPTVVRSIIMGICSGGARVGSTISPYLYLMVDGRFGKVVPLIFYGVLTFIVATLSIVLPETRRRKLLEKMKDVQMEDSFITNGKSLIDREAPPEDEETSPL